MVDTTFFKNNGAMSLEKISQLCSAELLDASKANVEVSNIATMQKAGEGDICFFYNKKAKQQAAEIKATACMTTAELQEFVPDNVIKLISGNPKLGFYKINKTLYSDFIPSANIATSAKISSTAQIGQNCFIGENVVIEDNVQIGDNCIINHNVVIGRSCKIGNNCKIDANAHVIYAIMGNDCYIYSGARIGHDGFGLNTINGKHERIPQLGRVVIGNDVEIGANTCVDRGALDDTVISDGCRIDNLVQVAHNAVLGRGCVIVSQVGIAGSSIFGDYVVCGGQSGIAGHLKIGSGSQIAAQTGVIRDVEPGSMLMGTPAVPLKDFMRQASFLHKVGRKEI